MSKQELLALTCQQWNIALRGATVPSFVRPFLPWIAYAAVGGLTDWRWGALAGLVLTAWGLTGLRRAGRGWDAAVIELGSLAYFVLVTGVAFADPGSPLRTWTQGGSSLWLAVLAWGSLLAGRPFTLGIAKADVPAEYWNTPAFLHVNRVITAVWAAAFTATGAVLLLLHGQSGTAVAVNIAGFVLPALFTARYTAAARARAPRAAA
jgi:hypothetical protein